MTTNNFFQPIINQLKQEILEGIKPLFEDLKKSYKPEIPDENLTRKETCAILKINLSTLWSWTKKEKLKSYGLGNRVYYKRSEVEAAIIELNPNNYKTGNTNNKKLGL